MTRNTAKRDFTMHDLIWFFTTGRFDPAWVQAVMSTLALMATIATLGVLIVYACDTRKLAKSSVEQSKVTEQQLRVAQDALILSQEQHKKALQEKAHNSLKNFHRAYAALFDIKLRIEDEDAERNRLRITPRSTPAPIRPPDWHEIAAAIYEQVPAAEEIVIGLGTRLQELDNAMLHYWNDVGPVQTEPEALRELGLALNEAKRDVQSLNQILTER